MGGEQEAVLVYGPKKCYNFLELVKLFGLVDQEFDEDAAEDLVMNFLNKFHLSIVFDNNCDWSECYIGVIINDYENFVKTKVNMTTVNDFCEKYKLSKPTFFGGIIGEFE